MVTAYARDAIRPANFTPPSDADLASAGAEHASILYRDAEVISASPRDASARAGATLTIRGWGFVDASEPGSASSPWGGLEGRGVGHGVGRGGASCVFSAWGGGATADTHAGWNGSFAAANANANANASFADRHIASRAASASAAAAAASAAHVSIGTFTSAARVVSGGMATCELPAFPPSAVPPGATIRILASLRLDGVARTLAAPVGAAVHLVAPDADDATFRLASDDDGVAVTDANGAAPPAVAVPARMGEEEEEESKSAVAGDAEGAPSSCSSSAARRRRRRRR